MSDFKTLWEKYPSTHQMKSTCRNTQAESNNPHDNYCAINLSECFNKSGFSVNGARGVKCWGHKGPNHILRAEDFADWLTRLPPSIVSLRESIDPKKFQNLLEGRTGIVFFKDYWTRGNERTENRSGDHIDLWNKNKITSGSMFARNISEFLGFDSDLNASREIAFWEVS